VAQDLLDAAATIAKVERILPRIVEDASGVRILLPGDPGYDALIEGDLTGGTRVEDREIAH
jgi:hypothetical protein